MEFVCYIYCKFEGPQKAVQVYCVNEASVYKIDYIVHIS